MRFSGFILKAPTRLCWVIKDKGYRIYLKNRILTKLGYDLEHWLRVEQNIHWETFLEMFRGMSDERQDAVFTTGLALAERAPGHMIQVTDDDGGEVLCRGPERRTAEPDAGYDGPERGRPNRVRRL